MKSKRYKNSIKIASIGAILLLLIAAYLYSQRGLVGNVDLDIEADKVSLIRFSGTDKSIEIKKSKRVWLVRESKGEWVEADDREVKDFLQMLSQWDIREVVKKEEALKAGKNDEGKVSIYKRGICGLNVKLATYRWAKTDSAVFLKAGRGMYNKMYIPSKDYWLPMYFSTAVHFWKNKWICDYYQHQLSEIEIENEYDEVLSYKVDTGVKTSDLAAFKSVYFDRYISKEDTSIYNTSLKNKRIYQIKIRSVNGNSSLLQV